MSQNRVVIIIVFGTDCQTQLCHESLAQATTLQSDLQRIFSSGYEYHIIVKGLVWGSDSHSQNKIFYTGVARKDSATNTKLLNLPSCLG